MGPLNLDKNYYNSNFPPRANASDQINDLLAVKVCQKVYY